MSAAGWLHEARNRALRDPGVSPDLYLEVIEPLLETVEDLLEAVGDKSAHRDVGRIWTRDKKVVRDIIDRRLR